MEHILNPIKQRHNYRDIRATATNAAPSLSTQRAMSSQQPQAPPHLPSRADGGSELPATTKAWQASAEEFRRQSEARQIPAFSLEKMMKKNQKHHHGSGSNVAPTATMYQPTTLNASQPRAPMAQMMPQGSGILTNARSAYEMGAAPFFSNAQQYPINTLGNAAPRAPMTNAPSLNNSANHVAMPTRAGGTSHVAYPNFPMAGTTANRAFPALGGFRSSVSASGFGANVAPSHLQQHALHNANDDTTELGDSIKDTGKGLRRALKSSQKLTKAIEQRPFPPHESSTPPTYPVVPASAVQQSVSAYYEATGYGFVDQLVDQEIGHFPSDNTISAPSTPQAVKRASLHVPPRPQTLSPYKQQKAKAAAAKRPRAREDRAPVVRQPGPIEEYVAMELDAMQAPSAAVSSFHHDSDADASGDSDSDDEAYEPRSDDYEPAGYSIAHGMAQKAPRRPVSTSNSKQKIKLKVNARKPTTSDPDFRPEVDATAVPAGVTPPGHYRARNGTIKKGNKPSGRPGPGGPKPGGRKKKVDTPVKSRSPDKKALAPFPDALKDKLEPDGVADLLSLIAFETESYNQNPKRQEELEAYNRKVKNHNDARNRRIRTAELRAELEENGRDGLRENVKRRGSIAEAAGSGRKRKARKTKKSGNGVSDAIEIPDDDVVSVKGDTTVIAGDEFGGSTAHETELDGDREHDADDGDSDEDYHLTDNDHSTKPVALPSLRRLEPAPGSYIIDEHGNAVPNPGFRRGQALPVTSESEGPVIPKRKLRNRDLSSLMAELLKEKMTEYKPRSMSYLMKRIGANKPAEAAASETAANIPADTADAPPPPAWLFTGLPVQEKSLAEQVRDALQEYERREDVEMVDAVGAVEDDALVGHMGSDVDAEGETD